MTSGSDSLTNISEFNGHHYWTIKNWKGWVGCSEADATIYSEKFSIPITNSEGMEEETFWMIKAFPKKYNASGKAKDMLAFRLVSLNEKTPRGMFHFKTVTKSIFGGETTVSKFKPLPLDAAFHWMTCIRYHTSDTLTIKVKVKIVTNQKCIPAAKRKGRSVLGLLGTFLMDMDRAVALHGYPRHIRYTKL